jgi:hypothetical protein
MIVIRSDENPKSMAVAPCSVRMAIPDPIKSTTDDATCATTRRFRIPNLPGLLPAVPDTFLSDGTRSGCDA